MKWESTEHTISLANKLSHLLPKDFDYQTYIELYPDLAAAGIDDYQKAKEHYLFFGIRENRTYKIFNDISYQSISEFNYEVWNPTDSKNIMVFSPAAPDYDASSGGNRLYQLLKLLRTKLKYNVYFFCNNPLSDSKYLDSLKSLGIKTYYSSAKINMNMEVYIKQLCDSNILFNNAIFCWYDMAYQYINIVKKHYPEIKIIVDSVDVHWIREQRGKNEKEMNVSQKTLDYKKNIEKSIYNNADVVFAITETDKSYIEKEIGYKNIKILSNIHYEKRGKLGHNIFFIGNYAHSPNVQAAIESIDIFNRFTKTETYKNLKHKQPNLLIVGPNINDKIIEKINKSNNKYIKVLGQIDNLENIYKQSCLCLSPLYWGAGIKGKICDSSMRGIPILSTDIGNEGIGFTHKKNALISNNTTDFIKSLEYFFSLSNKERTLLGNKGREHISKIVSEDAAISCLKHTLEDKHIVISIVAYSQTDKLKKCLQSILDKTNYNNYTIAISDNSNNSIIYDIIQSFINKYGTKINYIKNKTNKYFIETNNNIILSKKYLNSDILLLNDDIEIVSDGWLNYLYSTAYSSNDIAAVGGKTLYPDLRIAEAGAELYSDGTGRNLYRYSSHDCPESNIRKSVGYCSGCLLYMRRDAIKKIGALDTNLKKMYYEDSEWQYRAHINGLKTIYEPRCIAIHHEGSSSGNDITKGAKQYQEINRKIFVDQYKNLKIEQYNS